MKLIIEETTEKMSESAMQIVLGEMMQDKQVNISLTSGRSPEKMYEMMVPAIKASTGPYTEPPSAVKTKPI